MLIDQFELTIRPEVMAQMTTLPMYSLVFKIIADGHEYTKREVIHEDHMRSMFDQIIDGVKSNFVDYLKNRQPQSEERK
jgi:hypothetical protein